MLVDVAKHEHEAMYQLVLAARAIADILKEDHVQSRQLKNWAQMVEDVVNRLDGLK